MKRLILFLVIFLSALFVQAQVREALSRTLPKGVTYYKYTGVAADTLGADLDTITFVILSNKNTPVAVAARIEVTVGESETEDYEYRLQGKIFENDTWTSLVDSSAQTGDVTLYTPNVSLNDTTGGAAISAFTNQFYRYFRVLLATDGTCTAADTLEVDYVIFKLYER